MATIEITFDELIAVAPPPPVELLAFAESEATSVAIARRSRLRRRVGGWIAGAAAFLAFAFTAPGHAATGWIADFAGIGESPTLPQPHTVDGTQVVLNSGLLENGMPYEIVAKKVADFGERGSLCFHVDWPATELTGGGGLCTQQNVTGKAGESPISNSGVTPPIDATGPGRAYGFNGPALYFGIVDASQISRVVLELSTDSKTEQIDTTISTLEGEALARIGGEFSVSIFSTPLSADQAMAIDQGDATVKAVGYNDSGEVVDRQSPSVFYDVRDTPEQLAEGQAYLADGPLPADLPAIREVGELRSASAEDLAKVRSPDWTGVTALDAIHGMSRINRGSQTGPVRVYLANAAGEGLVYVVTTEPDESVADDPSQAIGVFDAEIGGPLVLGDPDRPPLPAEISDPPPPGNAS